MHARAGMLRRTGPLWALQGTVGSAASDVSFGYGAAMSGGYSGMLTMNDSARGRRAIEEVEPNQTTRPAFDLFGKTSEWAKTASQDGKYFYLEYLVGFEGYPEHITEMTAHKVTKAENMNLRLVSLAEERKFWKAYYFLVDQYEVESHAVMDNPIRVNRFDNVEYALRMSGNASPRYLAEFVKNQLDDYLLSGVSSTCAYAQCDFPADVTNVLDGSAVLHMLRGEGMTREDAFRFVDTLEALKRLKVRHVDDYGRIASEKVVAFDEVPTLDDIPAALGLEGGIDRWFIDVREFYSNPGRMIFHEDKYHEFLLDYYLMRCAAFGVFGSRAINVTRKPTKEEADERRRGWFHVI